MTSTTDMQLQQWCGSGIALLQRFKNLEINKDWISMNLEKLSQSKDHVWRIWSPSIYGKLSCQSCQTAMFL